MKNMNKLVALLLAAVMVLGMIPTVSAESEAPVLALGDNNLELPASATGEGVEGTWTADADGSLTVKLTSLKYYDSFWAELFPDEDPWTEMPVDHALTYNYYGLLVNGESITSADGTTVDVTTGDVVTVKVANYYDAETKAVVNLSFAEASAHTHDYTAVVTEPTCTEGGYTTYTCSCGESYTADETPALGHDYVNGECTRCDAVKDSSFVDVKAGDFFFDPVEWAVELGITTGATETTFDPNGNCLRGHVVTFLWRAAGSPDPTTTENPFVDVKETDFFYKAVLWAVENELTNGIDATHFGPMLDCNRAQVVTFLWRAMGESEPNVTEHPFTDVAEDQFYYVPMLWAVENGITQGMTETTFGPTAVCNRAQVVTFLYRTLAE